MSRIPTLLAHRHRSEAALLETAPVPTQNPVPIGALTGSIRLPGSPTGAIRTLGPNPATAPIMLHPGDSIPKRRRTLYIVLLGALTALGPFTIDLYLPAFPVLEADFNTTAAATTPPAAAPAPMKTRAMDSVPRVGASAAHVLAMT